LHTDLHSPGWKTLRHCACPLRVLRSGNSQIRKKCQDSNVFPDLQNFTCKYSYGRSKVPPLFL
jgi:hypothetical protein